MRVTSKGQVTIPRDLRELTGIMPNSEVVFSIASGKLVVALKNGGQQSANKERLDRFLETLDRLEGTGDQDIDGDALIAMTRDR